METLHTVLSEGRNYTIPEKKVSEKRVWYYCRIVVWYCFYSGTGFSNGQMHLWAGIIGIVGGCVVTLYQLVLDVLIVILWHTIPIFLKEKTGLFNESFSYQNYIWMLMVSVALLNGSLLMWKKMDPGALYDCLKQVHQRGYIDFNWFLPAMLTSWLTLASGISGGPETPMVILIGSVGSAVAYYFKQPVLHSRVLTICGMGAGVAVIFGIPLGGAVFALELPHRNGVEYYEAFTPALFAAVIGVLTNKAILEEPYGGSFDFTPLPPSTVLFIWESLLLSVLSGLLGILFITLTKILKKLAMKSGLKHLPVILLPMTAALMGVIGVYYPPTVFWGEYEMNTILSRGKVELPNLIMADKSRYADMDGYTLLVVAFLNMFTTSLAQAAGFPAGLILPLLYTAACFGTAVSTWFTNIPQIICVGCFMVGLLVSVTRTPLAAPIIILELARPSSQGYSPVTILPLLTTASIVSLFMTRKREVHFYSRKIQHNRCDLLLFSDLVETEDELSDRNNQTRTIRPLLPKKFRPLNDDDDDDSPPTIEAALPNNQHETTSFNH